MSCISKISFQNFCVIEACSLYVFSPIGSASIFVALVLDDSLQLSSLVQEY